MNSELHTYIGKDYTFDDGAIIRIFQLKRRDDGWWVTYEVIFPGCLAKRHVMTEQQFIETYSHLFV